MKSNALSNKQVKLDLITFYVESALQIPFLHMAVFDLKTDFYLL